MSFRFFRRMSLIPGVSLNLSKSGPSLSFGPRGAKFTVGAKGTRTTFGIPGTGLYYTNRKSYSTGLRNRQMASSLPARPTYSQPPAPHLDLGFFERLVTPPEEQQFVEGLKELAGGNKDEALAHLSSAGHLADGAFIAGWLSLAKQDFFTAEKDLGFAIAHESEIGKLFSKYGISPHIELAISDELIANLSPTPTAARLAMVEVFQRQQRWDEAVNVLQHLYKAHPEDPVIRLSVVELLMHLRPNDKATCSQVVKLAEGIQDESAVSAAILLYKCKALRGLAMPAASIDVLSGLLRKKSYPDDLLKAVRYERALAYQDANQAARSRADLEKLYSEAPEYEDVAQRLGVGG